MLAAETVEGLERLSVVHHTTLPYSPQQNGKQELFCEQIEGRFLPMLEGEPHLTLDLVNTATQAWVEQQYQRKVHSEIREAPLERYRRGPRVGRESPGSDALGRAFRTEVSRKQRRSDGTVIVDGVRFEVPSACRTLLLHLRVARWDLSSVDLVDPRSGDQLATLLPIDDARNAERLRRVVGPADAHEPQRPVGTISPTKHGVPTAGTGETQHLDPPWNQVTHARRARRRLLIHQLLHPSHRRGPRRSHRSRRSR